MSKMTEARIRQLYPRLNDRGVANYLAEANRHEDPGFQALLAERRERDECLLKARIAEGTPWISDCLVHEVVGDIDHHFRVSPDAATE